MASRRRDRSAGPAGSRGAKASSSDVTGTNGAATVHPLASASLPVKSASLASSTSTEAGRKVVVYDGTAQHWEFGGPWGTFGIMIFSHVLMYYIYYITVCRDGALWLPRTSEEAAAAWTELVARAAPTKEATVLYFAYLFFQALFAFVLPGVWTLGMPDPNGNRLKYLCNGYAAWWATLGGLVVMHYSDQLGLKPLMGNYKISSYVDHFGPVMTVSVIFGNALSFGLYFWAYAAGVATRATGNFIYDVFMGVFLHPRIGHLDIKIVAEARVSWYLLFILTLSCAMKELETTGTISPSAMFMCLAHFLYANATAKGETAITSTWDLTTERFGWMLCFWNFAGVPFTYCSQSLFIHYHPPGLGWDVVGPLTVVLLFAYYVWDTSQSQKNFFRQQRDGVYVERWTFPMLPWATIHNAKCIETAAGSPLLVDGWWAYARKIHYTCDIVYALTWGMACGFHYILPYWYTIFFTSMILHRYGRDMERCARKYGPDWDRYLATVPYAFIPGVV